MAVQIRIGNDYYSSKEEAYLALRNKGVPIVGFTYDISQDSIRHNHNSHPSKYLPDFCRFWQKSNWLFPIKALDRIVDLCFDLMAENQESYMRTKNSAIIILYAENMDQLLSGFAFENFQTTVREIHCSVVNSVDELINGIDKRLTELKKSYDELEGPSKTKFNKWYYSQTRQIFNIARKRIESAITNVTLWEDDCKLIDLIRSQQDLVNASKEANKAIRRHPQIFREVFPEGL